MPLLLGRLRRLLRLLRSHGAAGLLASPQHIQNLFRSLRSSIGLVGVGLLLLCTVGVGLTGLGLILGAVIVLIVVIFIIVAVGSGRLCVPRLSLSLSQQLPIEWPRGHWIGSDRRWIVLVHICRHRRRGFSRPQWFGGKYYARNRAGIRIGTEHYVIERAAVEQSGENIPWRSRTEGSYDSLIRG